MIFDFGSEYVSARGQRLQLESKVEALQTRGHGFDSCRVFGSTYLLNRVLPLKGSLPKNRCLLMPHVSKERVTPLK